MEEVSCRQGNVDIGLQTDLNEDPDVYYFAGGRHVGCQTDFLEEYPTLVKLTFKSSPRIIVLQAMDSDMETAATNDSFVTNNSLNQACENLKEGIDSEGTGRVKLTKTVGIPSERDSQIVDSDEKCNVILTENIECSDRPITPIEMKCSATQLSAGALQRKNPSESKDRQFVDASTSPITQPRATSKANECETCSGHSDKMDGTVSKSTFAEKTKSGLIKNQVKSSTPDLIKCSVNSVAGGLKSSSSTSSSVSSQRGKNPLIPAASSKPNSNSILRGRGNGPLNGSNSTNNKIKIATIPNYRSNIASRCRTAVNTGQSQPQECNQKVKRSSAPVTPTHSTSTVTATSNCFADSVNQCDLQNGKCTQNSNSHILLSSNSNSSFSSVSSHNEKKTHWKVPSSQVPPGNSSKQGILRSKSMVNPILTKSQSSLSSRTGNNSFALKKSIRAPPSVCSTTGSLFQHMHSNSYISLPDESSYRRRSHTIDEDGWETVKARSNRSKWSSSNSSLASSNANQSRSSLDRGSSSKLQSTPEIHNQESIPSQNKVDNKKGQSKKNKSNGTLNQPKVLPKPKSTAKSTLGNQVQLIEPTEKKKESNSLSTRESGYDENESSMDEDEITKKEADLDDAIREEELLEKELLQVEKDFERIENDDSVENGSTVDNDSSASPEVPVGDDDINLDDAYFFVGINGVETIKKGDPPMNDPSMVPLFPDTKNSPSKAIDKGETLRRYEAKLAKAERNREFLMQIKYNQFVELTDKFKALNETTIKLVSERDELISRSVNRRKNASEKRRLHLKNIQRKAHDEDSKAKEIAFINLLEAQNKRHDYFVTAQEIEDRLQGRREDRRLKLEARSKKITLVIQRQEGIKQDWQEKLESLQEKRKKTEERIKREKEERARERTEMAKEKARDREVRISALNAAKQAEKVELQKKIKQKQEDSARRHEENIEQIRQKAIELGSFRSAEDNSTSSVRVCTLCKVMLQSEIHEMQHIRGRAHLDAVKKEEKSSVSLIVPPSSEPSLSEGFGLKYIADMQTDKVDSNIIHCDKSRYKSVKKHVKKVFQKLMDAGKAFEKLEEDYSSIRKQRGDPNVKSKVRKNILELERLVGSFSNNKGTPSLAIQIDRLMADIRKAALKNDFIQENILSWNALNVALKVIQCQADDIPIKCKTNACDMIHGFVTKSLVNGMYVVRGTGICTIMQICAERWSTLIPDDNRWLCNSPSGGGESLPTDPLIESLMRLLFQLLEYVANPFSGILSIKAQLKDGELEDIKRRTHDIIGYLVTSGVIDRITVYCGGVRGPVDDCPAVAALLQIFLDFLTLLVYILQLCWGEDARGCIIEKKEQDSTQLVAALESSELAGAVSMSYSLLLHQGAPSRSRLGDNGNLSRNRTPPPPGKNTAEVIKSTLCLINAMARLDLIALQNVLGSETLSLQFRHIASQLLWLIVPYRNEYGMRRLLTELIIAIGNFTVGNKHNQSTIQSGQTPTVLQLLCDLPEEYFTQKQLQSNLFPTLLAATHGCPENKEVLIQKNVDLATLDNYWNSDGGKENVIMKRLDRMILITNTTAVPKGSKKKGKDSNKSNQLKKLNADENVKDSVEKELPALS